MKIFYEDDKDRLQVIIKHLGKDEKKIGSVSFECKDFTNMTSGVNHKYWVTLFDHTDDDLYDGEFAE